MFIITNLDTDKLQVTVLDTTDNVKEPASIKDFISYLKAGVEFKGVSIEKDKSTNWNVTVPIEDTSEVFNIFYNITNDTCTGISKASDETVESKEVTEEPISEPSVEASEEVKSEEVSEATTDTQTEEKVEEPNSEQSAVEEKVEEPKEAFPESVEDTKPEEVKTESDKEGVSSEKQCKCGKSGCKTKSDSKCKTDYDTNFDAVIAATVNAICECKAKKADKKTIKKPRAKKSKVGESSSKDILSYLIELSSVLNYKVENPEIIDAEDTDKYLILDSTCSDFVFFKGNNVTISINGDYANNFAVKDEILKHLSKIPFKTASGEPINLYEECCGVSHKLSVYPPFSPELGVSDSDDVLVITINSLANA